MPHLGAVALREVFVHRNDVNALFRQGVQVCRQRSDKRLAFTRPHLCDFAFVEHHASDQLDVVMALAQRSPGRLTHDGERLRQQIVKAFSVRVAMHEFRGLRPQLPFTKRLNLWFQSVYLLYGAKDPLDFAFVRIPENFLH